MTDKEKAIVMAHTGVCMLKEDKFHIFHEYIEKLMNRPVHTFELASEWMESEIREQSRADFIKLCEEGGNTNDLISRADLLGRFDAECARECSCCEHQRTSGRFWDDYREWCGLIEDAPSIETEGEG